jgi:hypothetical protein
MEEPKLWVWRLCGVSAALGFAAGFLLSNSLHGSQGSLLSSKLLDWPFLTFFLLVCFVVLFFDSLSSLLTRGELTIAWSKDQSVKLRNLSAAVSGELTPIQEDIDRLKNDVLRLKEQLDDGASTKGLNAPIDSLPSNAQIADPSDAVVKAQTRRLREALEDSTYKWRSIERLSSIVGSSEDEVIRLLVTQDDIRLSRSMTGHQIAGLRSRVGSA